MENKVRDAADAVKGVLEAVPVYQDALQPVAKEIGTSLQIAGKTVRMALAPFTALVWGYEKLADYLDVVLTEKLKNVPPERIITPSPTVAVPVLAALRISAEEPSLRELYANLLATSMDQETARNVHPAFVASIQQMTPDEARIIQLMETRRAIPMITVGVGFKILNPMDVHTEHLPHFSLIADEAGCAHPDLWPTYLTNLARLGLVETHLGTLMASDAAYEDLRQHPTVAKIVSEIELVGIGYGTSRDEFLQLTALGQQFCKACVVRGGS